MVTLLSFILLTASLKMGRADLVNLFPGGFANEFTRLFSESSSYDGGGISLDVCPNPAPECLLSFVSSFRNINGECNNIKNPRWGAAVLPLKRLIPRENGKFKIPVYVRKPSPFQLGTPPSNCPSDCRSLFEGCQTTTQKLPSARLVSSTLHTDEDHKEKRFTNMLMQFSQFLDHDITLSPELEVRDCCRSTNPECMPIQVASDDAFYSRFDVKCLPFIRSAAFCPRLSKTRENFNAITAYLDASMVYGSDETTAHSLRSFSNGKLRVTTKNLLPLQRDGEVFVGDVRAAIVPGLVSLHAIFVREHNRLCDLLQKKPLIVQQKRIDWTDELLYQNAKRILAAEWQKIVIEDYLPHILGYDTVKKTGLTIQDSGSKYDSSADPSIFAVFSGAAFRFGHSLVPGIFKMIGQTNASFNITDHHFQPAMYEKNIDAILNGLSIQPCQQFDRFATKELTTNLFKDKGKFGEDLLARNIQRGRDHGIPSYAKFYELFGPSSDPNKDMSCWARKPQSFTLDMWERLKSVYLHPHDIDMFSGGLLETVTGDDLVGDTFKAIIALQFKNIMYGDRFFFTHQDQVASFNQPAITSIRKRTLGDIICDNANINQLPKNVFLKQDPHNNPLIDCSNSNQIDLDRVNFIYNFFDSLVPVIPGFPGDPELLEPGLVIDDGMV